MNIRALFGAFASLFALAAGATHEPWTTTRFPQDETKWWRDADWWERGVLPAQASHPVRTRVASYRSGDAEVPVEIFAPAGPGRFPVVVFLHGRRGIDDLTRLAPLRLAARGFTVVAPDLYSGRFIDRHPVRHAPVLEDDAAAAFDFALAPPEARGQAKTACYVSHYPHWQDPNAPEPMQIYPYAPEVDELAVPVLVFFGEHEQYQRHRAILAGIDALRKKKRDARVIVYPGVGRGFDFRPPEVRTLADDLATQDSLRRAAAFIRQHLAP